MKLLINEEDIKSQVSLAKSFSIDKLNADIRRAQLRWIKWILGPTLMNSLALAYEDGTTDESEKELLEYVHPALANIAIWMYIPKANMTIEEDGISQYSSDEKKPVTQWSFKALSGNLAHAGLDGLDDLIEFLEENTGIYAWNFANTRELFITSAVIFQKYVNIKSRRLTFLSMEPLMREVERSQVKATLGPDLYDSLKSEWLASGELSANNEKLLDFIRGAIAHFSYADFIIENSMISDDQGFHLLENSTSGSTESVTAAEQSRLRSRRDLHIAKAEKYLQQLADFLYTNADDYPLYKNSDLYVEGEKPSDHLENDSDSPIFTML
ncbi:DUF6712 family protein [Marinoscillum furvescens]|uniref:Uncharacterized protein n=1 Tax=Marinoscillum furvescens DSM 4134 TaxID=1122208 RepID=A0A3D9L7L8_MARFU|nr:DUF6712 family protein [Marinoscillum furvescens]REE01111.1 hypothetical protein C7460_104131 [Marinoscillum furvescens DSM 4134]